MIFSPRSAALPVIMTLGWRRSTVKMGLASHFVEARRTPLSVKMLGLLREWRLDRRQARPGRATQHNNGPG